ncbi:MAG: M64 family metallopeptidase, partial [Nitrospira sp.]|nr:M64 family metallopeptidase [Nitrospira sp.]
MGWIWTKGSRLGWILAFGIGLGLAPAKAAGATTATLDDDEILFLRLRIAGDRAEWIEGHRVPGRIVPDRNPQGTLEVTIADAAGAWKETVRVADPCLNRFEVEDPNSPGRLIWIERPQAEGEVHVRIPSRTQARRLSVTRLLTPASGPIRALGGPARMSLGEFELPPGSNLLSRSLAPQGVGQPPTNSVPEPKPAEPILISLATNGPSPHRVDITFLAEGYRTYELKDFTERASAVLLQLLQTPPYS